MCCLQIFHRVNSISCSTVKQASKQINGTLKKSLSTITLTAMCCSELFLSLSLSGEALCTEITHNIEFVDRGFRELIVFSHFEKSEIILRLAFLFSKRYISFLFGRSYYKGCVSFLPFALEMERKRRVWFSLHTRKKKKKKSAMRVAWLNKHKKWRSKAQKHL